MKAQFTKYGPRFDYRGAQVVMDWEGRTLLGDVREVRRNETRGIWLARVTHFNGEPWPIEPALFALDILERTFETVQA